MVGEAIEELNEKNVVCYYLESLTMDYTMDNL